MSQKPSVLNFRDYVEYFGVSIEFYRTSQKHFSLRRFSKRIGWPYSYLYDLLAKRKNLTLLRAIQFAKVEKLDVFETEHLIHLCLQVSEVPEVATHFRKAIETKTNTKPHSIEIDYELISDVSLLGVFEWAKCIGRPFKTDEVMKALYIFPELDGEKALLILNKLKANGLIASLPDQLYQATKPYRDLSFDENGVGKGSHIHEQFAKNFIEFCRNPQDNSCYYSGFLPIPVSRVNEIVDRIVMLRNWIGAISDEMAAEEDTQNSLVFQIDLNLFPINKHL